jgi:hypothetical protein
VLLLPRKLLAQLIVFVVFLADPECCGAGRQHRDGESDLGPQPDPHGLWRRAGRRVGRPRQAQYPNDRVLLGLPQDGAAAGRGFFLYRSIFSIF